MGIPAVEWWLTAETAGNLESVLAAQRFSMRLETALRARLNRIKETGEGVIIPDAAVLDLFSEEERLRWWAVLAEHPANDSYRWPVCIRLADLEAMAKEPAFAEGVARIRRWGLSDGAQVRFADFYALNNSLEGAGVSEAFFRRLLGVDTRLAKLSVDSTEPGAISAWAAYWQSNGRSRALEPILMAVARVEGHDRIDLAHLLPRLARSLLYTYPPDFSAAAEPGIENAVIAAGFFDPELDTKAVMSAGFSSWLREHCDEVTGSSRQYGDIIVFEDIARTSWPFSAVYLADGILFGRRPTKWGPWELLPETEIAGLNPRLNGVRPKVFRAKGEGHRPAFPGWVPHPWARNPELTKLQRGPWGCLKSYDVLLAPSSELIEGMVVPDKTPVWRFAGTDLQAIFRVLREIEMPDAVRRDLEALFKGAAPDSRGTIVVRPTLALVLATPAAFRERLFSCLVHGETAGDYAQEVLIPAQQDASLWFSKELVPARARELLLKLTYRKGDGLALSDFGALFDALTDADERIAALRALYRTPALIVLLEKPLTEQIEGIADYWRLDPQKSLSRLLESFAQNEDFRYLDVVHLLPPLARELMNVYTAAWADIPTPSCYWSALNFGAERPDSRLLVTVHSMTKTEKVADEKLQQGYELAASAERLGDIIVYRRRTDGFPLHMCAYVAADVVFTKNGLGVSSPWCLMRLEQMDALYLKAGEIERMVYRERVSTRD